MLILKLQPSVTLYPNSVVVNLHDANTSSLYNSQTLWLVQFYSHWLITNLIHNDRTEDHSNIYIDDNILHDMFSTEGFVSVSDETGAAIVRDSPPFGKHLLKISKVDKIALACF